RADTTDEVEEEALLFEAPGELARTESVAATQLLSVEEELVGFGESLGLGDHRELPVRKGATERLRVRDDGPGVLGPDAFELEQGLSERGDPVPMSVIEDPPDERRVKLSEQVLAVGDEESTLGSEERLVGATVHDVGALAQRVLKPSSRDQAEDVGGVVEDEGIVGVRLLGDRAQGVREQEE